MTFMVKKQLTHQESLTENYRNSLLIPDFASKNQYCSFGYHGET